MAMLIGKFHKLIQSRLVWGVILVIIVLSFVVWGTPFIFTSKADRDGGMAGTLDGKGVTRGELWNATMHIRMAVALSTGRMPPVTEQTEPILKKAAWRRIAGLRETQRLGFAAGEGEIQDAIRSQPVFQQNGQFSLEAYRGLLGHLLGESGLGERFFEEHVGQELVLRKLQMLAAQAVLAPPADVERIFSVLEDQFKIEVLELKRSLVESSVAVTAAGIKAFFEKDTKRYEIPPKVTVKVVHFDRADFLKDLPVPPQTDLEDYYDEHRAEFTVQAPAPAPTNAVAGATNAASATVSKLLPLEEVKGQLIAAMRQSIAMNRAEQASADFVDRIAPERRSKPVPFEDAARAAGLAIRTAGPFARNEPAPGILAGPEFNRAAFALNDTPDEYFSNPVRGETGYYAMALSAKAPARIPALDEVKDAVARDAREAAIDAAFDARVDALAAEVRSGKSSLAGVAKSLGLTVATPPPFSATSPAKDNPHAEELLPELAGCNAGEVTPAIRTADDTRLLARLVERIPASRGKLADMRMPISDMILREREGAFMRAFEEDLLRRGGFVDKTAKKAFVEE
jgi:peptidyl-prolyl cis-trans isomerase D